MAGVSLQDPTLAKRRFFHSPTVDASFKQIALQLWLWLMTQGGRPNLQVVEFAGSASDTVIMDGACRVFCIFASKPTTVAATLKVSNSATVQAAATELLAIGQAAIQVDGVIYPKGRVFSSGVTIASDTTPDGTSASSAADASAGVFLLGASS